MGAARLRTLLLGATALAACAAPAAQAQAPPAYGGGLFATLHAKGYDPTVGVTLEPRGDKLAFRFDTTLRCGHDTYQVSGHKVVPLAAGHAQARGHGSFGLARGRVRFGWTLSTDVGASSAAGVLDIRGTRRRHESCTHKPTRHFEALLANAPSGAAAAPRPNASYLGLSANRARGGMRLPVLLRTNANGSRVGARWSASAPCGRGAPETLINFTPPSVVRAGGSFSRSEHFKEVFADDIVRYQVTFRGHFTSDGAAGRMRARMREYGLKGKRLLTRCDTGLRQWTALLPGGSGQAAGGSAGTATGTGAPAAGDSGAAPSDGATTPSSPPPHEPQYVDAAQWSLSMTSDSGEYIGQGGSYSYATGDGQSRGIANDARTVSLQVFPKSGGDWSGGFWAPPGQALAAGTTYTADGGENSAALGVGGMGRGCGGSRGSFTFDSLALDSAGDLRTAKVRFVQQCEGSTKSLRGTWEFQAP